MKIVLPAVILFGIGTGVLIRSRTIRVFEALVVGLFGFFLAATGLGQAIGLVLDGSIGQHSSPAAPVTTTVTPAGPNQPGTPPTQGR
jgi:hypothetical protein